MSTSKTIASNTIIQFAARLIGAAAQALIVIILARTFVLHLGAEEGVRQMGRYATIFAFTVLFGTFSEFGLFPTLVKEFSENEGKARLILAKALPLRMIVAFIVAVAGIVLAFALHFEAVITTGIILLAISTLWTAVANTVVAYFQSRLMMVYPATAEIVGRLIGFCAVATAALLGASLSSIVLLSLIGFFVTFIANLVFLSRFEHIGWEVDVAYWKKLLKHAAPVGMISVLALIYFKIDAVMLAAMRDKFDTGIYSIPYKLIDVLITFPTLFVGNVFPVLARVLNDHERAQALFRKSFDFLAVAGFPVAFGVFALANPIIHLIGGETYLHASSISIAGMPITAVEVLRILIWAVLFSFFGNMLSTLLVLKNLQSRYVWAALAATLFNVGVNFLIIPRYSYFGTSLTTVATEILVAVPGWYLIYKTTHFRPIADVALKAALASIIMGLCLWPLQQLPYLIALALGIPLGLFIYLMIMHLSGALKLDEIRQFVTRKVS